MYPVSIYLNDLRQVIWDSKNWNFIYVNITPTCPEYCPNIYIVYLSKGYLTLICWKCAQSNEYAYICTAKFLRGTEAPIRTGELSAKGHLDISDIMWGVYEMNNLKLAFCWLLSPTCCCLSRARLSDFLGHTWSVNRHCTSLLGKN